VRVIETPVPAVLPPPGDPQTLWVIDLSGFVFRAYHALPPRMTSSGEPVHAVHGTIATLQKLIGQHRPSYLAVAIDSVESKRKDLYPEYKSNRKDRPPDLLLQAGRVREIAEAYAIPCLEAPGWEADDVIATVVKGARAAGLKVVIASADKDLLQLIEGENVVMWDGMRDRVYGVEETRERLGVEPHQVRDYLALVGDSSDNVPGVRSVGPKTAVQLLATYGSFEGVYARIDEIEKKSLKEKLVEFRGNADMSRELVTLKSDLDLDMSLPALKWGGADLPKLKDLFRRLEMMNQLAGIDRWAALAGMKVDRPPGEGPPPKIKAPRPPRENVVFRPAKPELLTTRAELAAFVAEAKAKGTIALFSVLEEGLPGRAPQVGLGLAIEGRGAYLPIGHVYLGRPDQLKLPEIAGVLSELSGVHVVVHDHKRERQVWGALGAAWLTPRPKGMPGLEDTMLGSYLIEAEKHEHHLEDAVKSALGHELLPFDLGKGKGRARLSELEVERMLPFAAMRAEALLLTSIEQIAHLEDEELLGVYRDLELPLSEVLYGLERAGVAVDVDRLSALSQDFSLRMAKLEARCHEVAGHPFPVRSPRALEIVLFDELGLPALKRTKTARSTDHEVLEELAPVHPLPELVLELRMLEKLKGTYLDALARERDPLDERVHPRFNQAVTATGRLSSSDPNLQNIPIRSEEGRLVRAAFVAPPGFSIVSLDYSQIELRVLAHFSKDPDLCDAYRTASDVHVRTAKALFDVDEAGVTKEMRGRAKTVNFAVIYGQTEVALSRNLRIPQDEAARYIRAFFQRYEGVTRWLDAVVDEARMTGSVRTLLGRKRDIPLINARGRMERWAAERIAKNTPIQGSAADLMKLAMLAVATELVGKRSRMILTVHDELVIEMADEEHDELLPKLVKAMETVHPLEVPLVVEHGTAKNWADAH
jgi:DNA polymerase-1